MTLSRYGTSLFFEDRKENVCGCVNRSDVSDIPKSFPRIVIRVSLHPPRLQIEDDSPGFQGNVFDFR
jgi:hypothetical protein